MNRLRRVVGAALVVVSAVIVFAFSVTAAQRVLPPSTINCKDEPTDVHYVFSAAGVLRDVPDAGGAISGRVTSGEIGNLLCVTDGWSRIRLMAKGPERTGWLATTGAPRENVVIGSVVDLVLKQVRMEDKMWPIAVRVNLLRGIARVGYTQEQIEVGLGNPLRSTTDETAAGVTETWLYSNQVVTFQKGRVTAIKREN